MEDKKMNKFKIGLAAIAIVSLPGCGTTGSVLKMGPDTYRVSASKHNMVGGAPAAESDALSSANAYCEKHGKEVLVTNSASDFDRPFYTYTATFQCLGANDPGLHRPNYRPAPSLIIEDNRK